MKQSPTEELNRFVKFSIAGGSGILVDMFVLFILVEWSPLTLPLVLSKVIAAETAMVNNFIWNDLWTFQDRSKRGFSLPSAAIRFLKFNLICTLGLALAVATLFALHQGLGINLYTANLIAIVAAALWNYLLSSQLAWGTPPQPTKHQSLQ